MTLFDFLIVGGGIAGKLLSYELLGRGKNIILLQESALPNTSRHSSALLNPYQVKTGMIDATHYMRISKSIEYYQRIEEALRINILQEMSLRIYEEESMADTRKDKDFFVRKTLTGLYKIDTKVLLNSLDEYLKSRRCVLEKSVTFDQINCQGGYVQFQDLTAQKIIFAGGSQDRNNPYTHHLPFTSNRGDFLILHSTELEVNTIYHYDKYRLVPLGENKFWYGTNNLWSYENLQPSDEWREEALSILNNWLGVKYKLLEHGVAERPTTAGQFPFIGLDASNERIGIFNGFGTRGYSLTPYYAISFADYLCGISDTVHDYDADRFKRLFQKR